MSYNPYWCPPPPHPHPPCSEDLNHGCPYGHNVPRIARYASNTATWASNQIPGLAALGAATAGTAAFGSNAGAFGSNLASWASNNFSNFARIENASNWNWASNVAAWASNAFPKHLVAKAAPSNPEASNSPYLGKFVQVSRGADLSNIYFVDYDGTSKLVYNHLATLSGAYGSNTSSWLSNHATTIDMALADPPAVGNPEDKFGKIIVNARTNDVFYVDFTGKSIKIEGPYASNTATWLSNGVPALKTAANFGSNTSVWASNTASWLSNNMPDWTIVLENPLPAGNPESLYGAFTYNQATDEIYFVDYTGDAFRIWSGYDSNTATWASNSAGLSASNWNYASNTATWLSNNLPNYSNVTSDPKAAGNPESMYGTFTFNTTTSNIYYIDYTGTAKKLDSPYDSNTATWASNVAAALSNNNPVFWSNVDTDPAATGNPASMYGRMLVNPNNGNVYYVDETGKRYAVQNDYWVYPPNKPYTYTMCNVGINTTDAPLVNLHVADETRSAMALSMQDDTKFLALFSGGATATPNSIGVTGTDVDPNIKWDEDSDLRFGTGTGIYGGWKERMCILSDGRVGIGEDAPISKLHVVHDSAATMTGVTSEGKSGNNTYRILTDICSRASFWRMDNTYLFLMTTDANDKHGDWTEARPFATRLDSKNVYLASTIGNAKTPAGVTVDPGENGRVAVGHTDPQRLLHVGSIDRAVIALSRTTNGPGQSHTQFLTLMSGTPTSGQDAAIGFDDSTNLRFGTQTGITVDEGATGWSEKMCILNNGHVGIGRTDPWAKLTVNGNIAGTGICAKGAFLSAEPEIFVYGAHMTWNEIGGLGESIYVNVKGTGSGGHVWYGALDTNQLSSIRDTDNQLMRLTVGGNLGLGKTWGCGNPDPVFAPFNTPLPTHQLALDRDSAYKPGANTTWDNTSDIRLKEDIVLADIDKCYENVKNIPLKYYRWRDEVYTDDQIKDRHALGWIAQDVEAHFPKAVSTGAFKDMEDCKYLNASQLYACMYGAIQKLQAINDEKDAEIADLKAAMDRQAAALAAVIARLDAASI